MEKMTHHLMPKSLFLLETTDNFVVHLFSSFSRLILSSLYYYFLIAQMM